jgi:tRNA nucleotidyltransferase (CCA-adding enzyme)
MDTPPLPLSAEQSAALVPIAAAVAAAGGQAVLVGGSVRDHLLGMPPRGDADVEIFGLDGPSAARVLGGFGKTVAVGRAFGVLRVKGLDVDFSLPRASSAGAGVRGDLAQADPALGFAAAARRRDLTINAMGLDVLSGDLLDPLGGRADLAARRLRAAEPALFAEDPVRGLRVARFAARFEMQPDEVLLALCRGLDLSGVAPERLLKEWLRILLEPARPSLALQVLDATGLISHVPEVAALRGVPQDPRWHPEGDVWVHTLMVLDAAAALRRGDDTDPALMLAALCHDLGKPATTVTERGRVRAVGHEHQGGRITRELLQGLRAPVALTQCVVALVRHHLAPAQFPAQGAGPAAYRRLARRLAAAGADLALLERLARADQLGRDTADARAGRFPAGDDFLDRAEASGVRDHGPGDVVQGRDLIARGYAPGPGFSALLERCRGIQDETGLDDPQRILDRLEEGPGP